MEDFLDLRHHRSPVGTVVEQVEEGSVSDAAVLDDLRHAVGKSLVRQAVQHVRVHEHPFGLPEGTGQVFARLQVDGHLATYRRVHLCQEGGGDLNEIHPTQHRGGGEPSQVPNHAAPQGGYRVAAGQAEAQQLLPEPGEHLRAFGALPGGHQEDLSRKARLGQGFLHLGAVLDGHVAVGDHGHPTARFQHFPALLAHLLEQAPFHDDVIRTSR